MPAIGGDFGERHSETFNPLIDAWNLGIRPMQLKIELEQEANGRWIAEIEGLTGVLAYGASADEAAIKAETLALRVIADRLEHGESGPMPIEISLDAA